MLFCFHVNECVLCFQGDAGPPGPPGIPGTVGLQVSDSEIPTDQ